MFREAIKKTLPFTQPVIVSRVTAAGKCFSNIGAFIIINEDGWIITAGHIIDQYYNMLVQAEFYRGIEKIRASIIADEKLSSEQKKHGLDNLPSTEEEHTIGCSAWWGKDELKVTDMASQPLVGLGIGRLQPFNPSWVHNYPVFKDPTKNFMQGASLCKLGFPFHKIETIWDSEKMEFKIRPGMVPLPLFPIEGIFTREVNIIIDHPQPSYPLRLIETSSPGLKGQSGGPIFDTNGNVWGVQTHTQSYPLGFDPLVPGDDSGRQEHQFLNVGRGVHSVTIIGALNELKICFRLSKD